MNADPCHRWDKLGLFILAGLVVVVLALIVGGTYWSDAGVPEKGDVLLGGIATGLILFLRELVALVRAGWEEVTRGKVNEQLARATPAADPAPQTAQDAATDVALAAEHRADEIKGEG